jgi:diaminopimelate epimerase
VIDAHHVDDRIRLKMVAPTKIRLDFSLELNGENYRGHIVHVGDPHFVVYSRNIRDLDFVTIARSIRHHPALAPEGANVHFIEPVSRQRIKIRSFERGVEDETLACGSGCVSAAVSTFKNKDSDPPVTFEPQSGIPVSVDFHPAKNFQDIYLEGDARLVYRGEITQEALTGFPVE